MSLALAGSLFAAVVARVLLFPDFSSVPHVLGILIAFPVILAFIAMRVTRTLGMPRGWRCYAVAFAALILGNLLASIAYFRNTGVSALTDEETMAVESFMYLSQSILIFGTVALVSRLQARRDMRSVSKAR